MFYNGLKDNKDLEAAITKEKSKLYNDNNVVFCYPDYTIPDSDIPEVLKLNDYEINREYRFFRVKYDENKKQCTFTDTRIGVEVNPEEYSRGGAYGRNIDIKDFVLIMDRKDYDTAKNISEKIMSLPPAERSAFVGTISEKDNELAFMYFNYVSTDERSRPYFVAHEIHHATSNILIKEREKEFGNGKLGTEEYYKICEHSEKSAYLAEVLKVVESYHKGNNYDSFQAFPGTRYNWLKDKLRETNLEDRKELAKDMDFLVNASSDYWNSNISAIYRAEGGQFEAKTKDYSENNGITKAKCNEEEYLSQRSLMYRYKVYNPDTKVYEDKDLSKNIEKDIELNGRAKNFALLSGVKAKKKESYGENIIISEEIVRNESIGRKIKNFLGLKKDRE